MGSNPTSQTLGTLPEISVPKHSYPAPFRTVLHVDMNVSEGTEEMRKDPWLERSKKVEKPVLKGQGSHI